MSEADIRWRGTVVKGLSFSGVAQDSNPVEVDCKNGKVIRIRPFRLDKKYDRKPWKIEAKGKVFEASKKSLIPPFTLAYKNRINSPNRTMYPLKRVDWDPNGERNPQNRGISKYERISWDEATDLIAAEIRRVIKQYGPRRFSLSPTATARPRSFMPPTDAISGCWNFWEDLRCKPGIRTAGKAGIGEPSMYGDANASASRDTSQILFRILLSTLRIYFLSVATLKPRPGAGAGRPSASYATGLPSWAFGKYMFALK